MPSGVLPSGSGAVVSSERGGAGSAIGAQEARHLRAEPAAGAQQTGGERRASAARRGGRVIGLAVAKRLVEMHGGAIEATAPASAAGSDFILCLPLRTRHRRTHEGSSISQS